jgi:hypothetical protein
MLNRGSGVRRVNVNRLGRAFIKQPNRIPGRNCDRVEVRPSVRSAALDLIERPERNAYALGEGLLRHPGPVSSLDDRRRGLGRRLLVLATGVLGADHCYRASELAHLEGSRARPASGFLAENAVLGAGAAYSYPCPYPYP